MHGIKYTITKTSTELELFEGHDIVNKNGPSLNIGRIQAQCQYLQYLQVLVSEPGNMLRVCLPLTCCSLR